MDGLFSMEARKRNVTPNHILRIPVPKPTRVHDTKRKRILDKVSKRESDEELKKLDETVKLL